MSEPTWAEALLFYGLVIKPNSVAHVSLDNLVADVGMALYSTARARLGTHGPMTVPCYHVAAVESIRIATHLTHIAHAGTLQVGVCWSEHVRTWCRMRGISMQGLGTPAWHLAVTYEPDGNDEPQ